MAVEFRCVHALDVRNAALVLALMLDAHTVLEDVDALGQLVDVEMRSGVTGRLVVAETILILVAT